jgi:hypothetical protein
MTAIARILLFFMDMRSKKKMGQVTIAAKAERVFPILHDGEGSLNGKPPTPRPDLHPTTGHTSGGASRLGINQMLTHFWYAPAVVGNKPVLQPTV